MENDGGEWRRSLVDVAWKSRDPRAAFEKLIYAARYRFYKCDSALCSIIDPLVGQLFSRFIPTLFSKTLAILPRRSTILYDTWNCEYSIAKLEKFRVSRSENFNFERKEGSK